MDAYDFVHLGIYALGGEIKGKTKLQKNIYFLGVMTGLIEELGYRPHFYGPYSSEVAGAVDHLKTLGFICQNVMTNGHLDSRGFERARYDYQLNCEGEMIAQRKAEKHPELWEKIKIAAEALKAAGDLDYMKLSIAAKTYFILGKEGGKATIEELSCLASKFGWAVKENEISEAGNFLGKLKLVEMKE